MEEKVLLEIRFFKTGIPKITEDEEDNIKQVIADILGISFDDVLFGFEDEGY